MLVIIKVLSALQWTGQCANGWQSTTFIQHRITYSLLREFDLWKHYKGLSGLISYDLSVSSFANLLMFERMLLSLT